MRTSFMFTNALPLAVLAAVVCSVSASGQAFLAEIKSEPDPGRRSELALSLADESFDTAKSQYLKGAIHDGDVALDQMTSALNACVDSLALARKAKSYKKAEIKVALLQRRFSGLIDEIGISERGWAEQTKRRLEEIHEKLLTGVMSK